LSKNSDDRPHRKGQILHGRKVNLILTASREHCSRLQQWRCHAVIEDWMIPFVTIAANIAADTQSFLMSPKSAFLLEGF